MRDQLSNAEISEVTDAARLDEELWSELSELQTIAYDPAISRGTLILDLQRARCVAVQTQLAEAALSAMCRPLDTQINEIEVWIEKDKKHFTSGPLASRTARSGIELIASIIDAPFVVERIISTTTSLTFCAAIVTPCTHDRKTQVQHIVNHILEEANNDLKTNDKRLDILLGEIAELQAVALNPKIDKAKFKASLVQARRVATQVAAVEAAVTAAGINTNVLVLEAEACTNKVRHRVAGPTKMHSSIRAAVEAFAKVIDDDFSITRVVMDMPESAVTVHVSKCNHNDMNFTKWNRFFSQGQGTDVGAGVGPDIIEKPSTVTFAKRTATVVPMPALGALPAPKPRRTFKQRLMGCFK